MAGKFEGKVCLITGAASGIGRATAIKMASHGATLALSDINLDGVQETARLCERSNSHSTARIDVSQSSAVTAYMHSIVVGPDGLGRLDFVFNCAGVNPTALALTDTTDEYWDKLIDTNMKGTYLVTRAAIPHLPTGADGAGAIVNVTSTMGLHVAKHYAIYCATKFGVVGFTKAVAVELGPSGVRVNAVAPGYIDTPSNAGVVAGERGIQAQVANVAMGRMGTSEEVADVVAFLFSYEARYMTGAVVEVTGGRT